MTSETAIVPATQSPIQAALDRLTADEQTEYERYVRAQRPSLALDVQKRLYELFLQGLGLEELSALNPAIPRGALIKARVDGRWDERREAYLGDLFADTTTRLRQTGAEAVQFMGLLLAATHKEQGQKLKKYLQSGDAADLGELRVTSLKQYKDVIEALAKLVGTGGGKTPAVTVNVNPDGSGQVSDTTGSVSKWTPDEADAIRAALEKKRQG